MTPSLASRWLLGATFAFAALFPLTGAAQTEARVIVAFKPTAEIVRSMPLRSFAEPDGVAQQRAGALSTRAGRTLSAGRMLDARSQVVRATGIDSATLAARLALHPDVAWAVPDQRRRAFLVPNDPFYAAGPAVNLAARTGGPDAGQWHLRPPTALFRSAVNAQSAWDRVTAVPSVVVAVLDTGVLADHPDLAGRVLPGYDMVNSRTNDDNSRTNDGDGRDADASDPGDWVTAAESAQAGGPFSGCGTSNSSWHGTKVSTIIAARSDDGIGIAGIAGTGEGARILPVRVLGKCGGFDSDISAGMRWAAGVAVPGVPANPNPARVLNLSLGGGGSCTAVYRDAVNEVMARGAMVVAAAGNSVGQAVSAPANCAGVIAVAGLRHAGSKVGFSDLGPEITISAPAGNCVNIGVGEPCLYPILAGRNSGLRGPEAGGSTWSDSFSITVGTSFATPIVSGTIALMLSARPALTVAEIRSALISTARPFPTDGAGLDTDGLAVRTCRAPDSTQQLQCYCTTALCGAGMLDADAAVAAVSRPIARIDVLTASPTAGSPLQFSGLGTLLGGGRSVNAWAWTLVDGGGIASGFSSATNAATAALTPSAAGSLLVRLAVTDDRGETSSAETRVNVAAAAPPVVIPPVVTPAPSAGSGGGALGWPWLVGLALGIAALRRGRRPDRDG